MGDFQPLNPTGYEDYEVWQTSPGFEVRAYVSPKAQPEIKRVMSETNQSHAKVVGGYIYGYFEFIEAEVHDALEDPEHAHTWMTYFDDSPLAAFLIVYIDDFRWFLLHKDEAKAIQSGLDSDESTVDLGWVVITLENEIGLSVSNMKK